MHSSTRQPQASDTSSPLRIFLVEDNPTIRKALVESLEELVGAQIVGTAPTENEAVAGLDELGDRWDVALIDLFLEKGSGLSVLRRMKSNAARQQALVLTNYATPDARERCMTMGATAVYDKSTQLDQLFNHLTSLSSRAGPED